MRPKARVLVQHGGTPGSLEKSATRRTREGWPLLTVEIEVNGESKRTNERGPFWVGSLGISCWYKTFLFCLGCFGQPSTKYFFFTVQYFNSFVPIAMRRNPLC